MEITKNIIPGNTNRSSKILQKNGYIEISRKHLGKFKVIIYEKTLEKTMNLIRRKALGKHESEDG